MIDENFGSLALSGIQHYLYCPRQWALIQIEQQWKESYLTAVGRVLHERAHNTACREMRGDILIARALRISSSKLGVNGVSDVVEYHRDPQGISLAHTEGYWKPYPVEYKRGQRKVNDCDRAQLCAQAICLEEMHNCVIPEGALFYGQEGRREVVAFNSELRNLVVEICAAMHDLFSRGVTPPACYSKSCANCSLYELCMPKISNNLINRYLMDDLEDN